jgi:GNAT superfamily N-acetyltransferase
VGLVGELLDRAARATPAAVESWTDGWRLRCSDTGTWWSGAVLAHGAADHLARRIVAAERFFAEQGATARFQVCPDCPPGLDHALAERGYRWQSPVLLLTRDHAGTRAEPAPARMCARVEPELSAGWLAVLGATSGPGTDVEHETRLLHRIDRRQAYVTVLLGGEPAGIGRAVADDGWTGVFAMATAPWARRGGVAHLVLSTLAGWAEEHSSPRLYLQVEESNAAARRLYASTGFTPLATYHYRVRVDSPAR